MKPYASRTGTRRNLAALRQAEWGLLVSASGVWRTEGFEDWVAENGQWTERNTPGPFKAERYEKFLRWVADQPIRPQWIALPDIVFGGLPSLDLSRAWLRKLRRRKVWREQRFVIVVQDGMDLRHVRRLAGPLVGVFVGGSTEWKEQTLAAWAALARGRKSFCHVGRVNTARRIRLCEEAGVHSFDGSSASMFSNTLPMLDDARYRRSLIGEIARLAA